MPARTRQLPPSEDAAIAIALAETALPFADSPSAEVEHWIRILRMHGEVGTALQALGAGERPLSEVAPDEDDAEGVRVDAVYAEASRIAGEHGDEIVATADLLSALIELYGPLFDEVLRAHGVATSELLERLGRVH
jgi:hypothetical protein